MFIASLYEIQPFCSYFASKQSNNNGNAIHIKLSAKSCCYHWLDHCVICQPSYSVSCDSIYLFFIFTYFCLVEEFSLTPLWESPSDLKKKSLVGVLVKFMLWSFIPEFFQVFLPGFFYNFIHELLPRFAPGIPRQIDSGIAPSGIISCNAGISSGILIRACF